MERSPRTEGARSSAAKLRADLTHLLTEHVYLRSLAARSRTARPALEANAIELSELIRGIYGPAAGRRFGALWRDGTAAEVGAFLQRTVPTLRASAIAASLDASIAYDPSAAKSLHIAAGRMQGTAHLLARGIVSERRAAFTGSAGAAASALRSRLTGLLTERVYLQAATDPTAAATLDANAAALTRLLTATSGSARASRLTDDALRRAAESHPADPLGLRTAAARMARHAELIADEIARREPERFPSA